MARWSAVKDQGLLNGARYLCSETSVDSWEVKSCQLPWLGSYLRTVCLHQA